MKSYVFEWLICLIFPGLGAGCLQLRSADQLNRAGLDFYQQGQYKNALQHFAQASRLNPSEPEYANNAAMSAWRAGDVNHAYSWFQQALAVSNKPLYHYNAGNMLFAAGKSEQARQHAELALALDADYPDALRLLGRVAFARKEYAIAIKSWEKAARKVEDTVLENDLGMAFMETGDLVRAKEHLERSIQIQPTSALALYNLAVLKQRIGDLKSAADLYNRTLLVQPENHFARYNLSLILEQQGNSADARRLLEEFLRAAPSDNPARPEAMKRYSRLRSGRKEIPPD